MENLTHDLYFLSNGLSLFLCLEHIRLEDLDGYLKYSNVQKQEERKRKRERVRFMREGEGKREVKQSEGRNKDLEWKTSIKRAK